MDVKSHKDPIGENAFQRKQQEQYTENLPSRSESKYKDFWAAILFWIHLASLIAIFGIHAKYLSYTAPGPSSKQPGLGSISSQARTAMATSLGTSVALSLIITAVYTLLIFKFPRKMIIGSFVATILAWAAAGVYGLVRGAIGMGVTFLVLAVLEVLVVYLWRHRIDFSALLLETTVSVLSQYPNTITASVAQYVVQLGYLSFWTATLASTYSAYSQSALSPTLMTLLSIYMAFSLFWTTQALANVLHVTVAGVFATFYFVIGSGQTAVNPTMSSFRRATTWSFGSIALGTLFVALIQTLRYVLQSVRGDENNIVAACVDCFLSCIEQLLEYFNYYAFIQVAIYGKPFMQASRDTWGLIKRSAGEILINDNLIGNVLGIASLVCSALCVLDAFVCFEFLLPSAFNGSGGNEIDQNIMLMTMALCFVIGWTTLDLVGSVVHSGASTTIVCYCQDPEALQRTKPALYQRFISVDHNFGRAAGSSYV
jgi:hypothetical protein